MRTGTASFHNAANVPIQTAARALFYGEGIAEHTVPPATGAVRAQRTRWRLRGTRIGAARGRPRLTASSRDVGEPRDEREQHLGFLESARMDRELAGLQRPKLAGPITTALANMSNSRLLILAAGVLLLLGGLWALRFPVYLSDFDQWGFQVDCGSGFQSVSAQAVTAGSPGTHFVDQCHTAIAIRRAWTIPLVAGGLLLLTALLMRPSHQHSAQTTSDTPSLTSEPGDTGLRMAS